MDEVAVDENSAWTLLDGGNTWLEFSVPNDNWELERALWVFPVVNVPAPPAVPLANFTVVGMDADMDTFQLYAGREFEFIDVSENSPTQWEWIFEASETTESNEQNPKITFNQSGIFKITLKVTNETG